MGHHHVVVSIRDVSRSCWQNASGSITWAVTAAWRRREGKGKSSGALLQLGWMQWGCLQGCQRGSSQSHAVGGVLVEVAADEWRLRKCSCSCLSATLGFLEFWPPGLYFGATPGTGAYLVWKLWGMDKEMICHCRNYVNLSQPFPNTFKEELRVSGVLNTQEQGKLSLSENLATWN